MGVRASNYYLIVNQEPPPPLLSGHATPTSKDAMHCVSTT